MFRIPRLLIPKTHTLIPHPRFYVFWYFRGNRHRVILYRYSQLKLHNEPQLKHVPIIQEQSLLDSPAIGFFLHPNWPKIALEVKTSRSARFAAFSPEPVSIWSVGIAAVRAVSSSIAENPTSVPAFLPFPLF